MCLEKPTEEVVKVLAFWPKIYNKLSEVCPLLSTHSAWDLSRDSYALLNSDINHWFYIDRKVTPYLRNRQESTLI